MLKVISDAKIVKLPIQEFNRYLKQVVDENKADIADTLGDLDDRIAAAIEAYNDAEDAPESDKAIEYMNSILNNNKELYQLTETIHELVESALSLYKMSDDELIKTAMRIAMSEFAEQGKINRKYEKMLSLEEYLTQYDSLVVRFYEKTDRRKDIEDLEFKLEKKEIPEIGLGTINKMKRLDTLFNTVNKRLDIIISEGKTTLKKMIAFKNELDSFLGLIDAYGKARGEENRMAAINEIRNHSLYEEAPIPLPDVERTEKEEKAKEQRDKADIVDMFDIQRTVGVLVTAMMKVTFAGGIENPANDYWNLIYDVIDASQMYYEGSVRIVSSKTMEKAACKQPKQL